MAQLEAQAKSATTAREQKIAQLSDKQQNAIKASAQKVKDLSDELTAAGLSAQKQHASTKKALLDLNQNKTKANGELFSLGIEDTDNSKEDTKSIDNIRTYDFYLITVQDFSNGPCCYPMQRASVCPQARDYKNAPTIGKRKRRVDDEGTK